MHSDEHLPADVDSDGVREGEPELLQVCRYCGGELVYPLDWVDEDETHWRMLLRCPECESVREGIFTQLAVDVFADELDRGEDELIGILERIARERMSEAVDRFIGALHADLILPSDF